MKLLMIYSDHFAYSPGDKSLAEEPDSVGTNVYASTLVGLIHAEAEDEKDPVRCEKYLIKNLKWGARKNDTQNIILHSFSHLSASKAGVDFTRELLGRACQRLLAAGYVAHQTPFGYFLNLDLRAPGRSTARIFASF